MNERNKMDTINSEPIHLNMVVDTASAAAPSSGAYYGGLVSPTTERPCIRVSVGVRYVCKV